MIHSTTIPTGETHPAGCVQQLTHPMNGGAPVRCRCVIFSLKPHPLRSTSHISTLIASIDLLNLPVHALIEVGISFGDQLDHLVECVEEEESTGHRIKV